MIPIKAADAIHFNRQNFIWLDRICQDPQWEGVDNSLREAYAAKLAQLREEECLCLLECNGYADPHEPYYSWDGDDLLLWEDNVVVMKITGAKE